MEWTDERVTLASILTLSLGISTLFLVTATFALPGLFEFLGLSTIILGWFVLAPAYYFLTRRTGETDRSAVLAADERAEGEEDPFEILQRRYAAGDITESEFERKLDRLLETDDREAEASARRDDERSRDLELE